MPSTKRLTYRLVQSPDLHRLLHRRRIGASDLHPAPPFPRLLPARTYSLKNFTKFVINRNGDVVRRFEPTDDMGKVRDYILNLL